MLGVFRRLAPVVTRPAYARSTLLHVAGGSAITFAALAARKNSLVVCVGADGQPPVEDAANARASTAGEESAADKHWSGVKPGETFTFTINYDESYSDPRQARACAHVAAPEKA
jgi:hypothetical protein